MSVVGPNYFQVAVIPIWIFEQVIINLSVFSFFTEFLRLFKIVKFCH